MAGMRLYPAPVFADMAPFFQAGRTLGIICLAVIVAVSVLLAFIIWGTRKD
jgi:hypothetical protein